MKLVKALGMVKSSSLPLDLESQGDSIKQLIIDNGHDLIMLLVNKLIINVNNYFNVTRGLNTFQIGEISGIIISDYWSLRIEELIFIFQNAKRNAELFGSLDGSIIFGWIHEYEIHKENTRHSRHLSQKNSDYQNHIGDGSIKRLRIVTDKMRQAYEMKDKQMAGNAQLGEGKSKYHKGGDR